MNYKVIDKLISELGKLPEVNSLSDLQVDYAEQLTYFKKAPKTYKCYQIPKNSGGFRLIANPPFALKVVQRLLIKILEERFFISDCAHAYEKKRSIKSNALCHVNSRFLLKMDLNNYFNSIDEDLLYSLFTRAYPEISKQEIDIINHILLWEKGTKLCLSVGAPSSPYLSNVIMYDFDEELKSECLKRKIKFTRYADDLTFSTSERDQLFQVPHIVEELLEKYFSTKLIVNYKKTKFSSKAHNRRVTGVTLTNNGSLSLGRERKRHIRAMVHNYFHGKSSIENVIKLQGYLALSKNIEPKFFNSLKEKYGNDIIPRILRVRKPDE